MTHPEKPLRHTRRELLENIYRIERLIGEGAFAKVYLATHLALGVPRALKILKHDTLGVGTTEYERYATRFQTEAQLGARLNHPKPHPNLLQVFDYREYDWDGESALVLVMEYAPGGSLKARIGQPMPVAEVLRIALDLAEGLVALHTADVVHRDLKPSNILFDTEGHAKLADLGVAQVPGSPTFTNLTDRQREGFPGSPDYMSPEQEDAKVARLSPPSDVYALGVVVFQMLTGRLYKNLKPGTRPRDLRADVPRSLDDAISQMLADDPKSRPWNGREAAEVLECAQAESSATTGRSGAEEERELVLELAPGVVIDLVRITAGEFIMGSDKARDKDAYNDEQHQHKLYLPDYYIGRTPVTLAQFAVFVGATGYKTTIEQSRSLLGVFRGLWPNLRNTSWQKPRESKSDIRERSRHPVCQVSWEDAYAFCEWASQVSRRIVRLPTEAEWEKAARGEDGRLYPWGTKSPDIHHCNFALSVQDTTSVGNYSPIGDGPYQCVDMSGNVWEWTSSLYQGYPYQSNDKREDPFRSGDRVLRGGSFLDDQTYMRCACRGRHRPAFCADYVGFRVCVSSS